MSFLLRSSDYIDETVSARPGRSADETLEKVGGFFFFVLMKNKCCVGFSYIWSSGLQMWLNSNSE